MRTHGPLNPTDAKILDPLNFLPEDRRDKIAGGGGIAKLLVDSGRFAMQGKLICPVEEMGVVAASMSSASSASQSSEEGVANFGRGCEGDRLPGQGGAKKVDSATTPSPFTQKSSLSGLLSARMGAKNDLLSKVKSEEAGSKRNTSALAPRTDTMSDTGLKSVFGSAELSKLSEDKQREIDERRKRETIRDVGRDTAWFGKDPTAPSKDAKTSSKKSKSSARESRPKDKDSEPAGKSVGSSAKDSWSSDEKKGLAKYFASSDEKGSAKDSGSSDEKKKKSGKGPAPNAGGSRVGDKKSKGFDKVSAMVRKGVDELGMEPQRPSWAGSKDSSRSGSCSDRSSGIGGRVTERQAEEEIRRDMFSPTNSTSSMSSTDSSSGVITPAGGPTMVGAATKKSKKGKSTVEPSGKPSETVVRYVAAMMQTDPPLMTDKWVMTDTLPPVESFRERYESVVKEKRDLQEKLERSEDQRFKLQKTHKREVEQLLKQSKTEAKEVEFQGRVWLCGCGLSSVILAGLGE